MNNICIIGRLTKNPELRYTPQGKAVCSVSIAVNEGYGDNQQTFFFEVVVWGKSAESLNQYQVKGNQIAVEGSLRQDRWEKDGVKNSRVKINAHRIHFLEKKKEVMEEVDLGETK